MSKPFVFASSVPSAPSILKEKEKALKEEYAKVMEEISLVEQQYRLNSQRKKVASERKVKKGQETKHTFYTNEVAAMRTKGDTEVAASKIRIAKWEDKVEAIDKALALKIKSLEEAIEKAKQQAALEKKEFSTKIELENKKIEGTEKRVEDRLTTYYRPIMEALLEPEEVEEDVKMPPSYDKLVARKLNLEGSLSSVQHNLRICEEAEASPTPAPSSDFLRQSQEKLRQSQEKVRQEAEAALDAKFAAEEIKLKEMRDQARREDRAYAREVHQLAEAERLERQELLRSMKEDEERKSQLREKPKSLSPQEREREERRLKIHLEEMRRSQEYRNNPPSDTESDTSGNESDPKKESGLTFPPVVGNTKKMVKFVKAKK